MTTKVSFTLKERKQIQVLGELDAGRLTAKEAAEQLGLTLVERHPSIDSYAYLCYHLIRRISNNTFNKAVMFLTYWKGASTQWIFSD